MKLKYLKRNWNETRGDKYNHWGKSIWFFEVDNKGQVLRQIEIYENGKVLRYSDRNSEDEFGSLTDQKIDLNEFEQFSTDKNEFESKWK